MKIKKINIIFLLTCLSSNIFSQTITWSEQIATILYDNCVTCHRSGGIAPFSLITYNDAFNNRFGVESAAKAQRMPPWPPDTTFQRYSHERILSQQEIDNITSWVNNGAAQGDTALAPDVPVFPTGSILQNPDFVLKIPVYASKASTTDEYKCFFLPTGLTQSKYVKAIEVVPGNRAIVHHALVYLDTTGIIPSDSFCNVGQTGAKLLAGFTPGSEPSIFPNGNEVKMGMKMAANSVIVLQMHYPVGTAGQIDSTSVNFFFYPDSVTNVREINVNPILQNWALFIQADSIKTYSASYPPLITLPYDISVIGVFPHMHLLGQYIVAYSVTSTNDTIPLIQINKWDFAWQGFYAFKKIIKLPAGSKIYGKAKYDNTANNLNNPNSPPKLVIAGEATTDEMFLVYFQYLSYQQGDENLDLDSLLTMPNGYQSPMVITESNAAKVNCYPIPVNESVTCVINSKIKYQNLEVIIYDITGREIKRLTNINSNEFNLKRGNLMSGIYFYKLTNYNDVDVTGKLLIE